MRKLLRKIGMKNFRAQNVKWANWSILKLIAWHSFPASNATGLGGVKLARRGNPVPVGFGSGRWAWMTRTSEMCKIFKIPFPLEIWEVKKYTHLELNQVRNIILQHKGNSDELRKFIDERRNNNSHRKGRNSSPRYTKIFISQL